MGIGELPQQVENRIGNTYAIFYLRSSEKEWVKKIVKASKNGIVPSKIQPFSQMIEQIFLIKTNIANA